MAQEECILASRGVHLDITSMFAVSRKMSPKGACILVTRDSRDSHDSGMRHHLVELAVAKESELGENIEPEVEQAVEHDDPAIQRGQAELQHALDHVRPVELPQRHQAVGNGRLQVLLCNNQHHSRQRHQPQCIPAARRRLIICLRTTD